MAVLTKVIEMLTAFQPFEEDRGAGAMAPWPKAIGPRLDLADVIAPRGSRRVCELRRNPRSPAAEENGQAGDEGRGGQCWLLWIEMTVAASDERFWEGFQYFPILLVFSPPRRYVETC